MLRLFLILIILFFYGNSYSQMLKNRDSSINCYKDSIKTTIKNCKNSIDSSIKKQSSDKISDTKSNLDSIKNSN